jgi:hypothetical protein
MNLNSKCLDCEDCGSHNTQRFAPMKINLIKSRMFASRWRGGGVILAASVCLVWVAFISSSAQLKASKHVTSLELGQAAEGARVTIISDSALNDYEAFRRGDRFYVKIPLAEFAFSQPRFHGNGFDDVQVEKVGDSVVVSFKLQPGASAHVDQHGNRLDVIFAAPPGIRPGNAAALARNRANAVSVNRDTANPANQDRQRDVAGPVPSDLAQISRQRYANVQRREAVQTQRPARNARDENNQGRISASNNATVTSSPSIHVASPTPAPNYAAGSAYTPATATSTPVSSTVSRPTGLSANSRNSNLRDWFSANRKASLLGALFLAGLLALLAAFLYRGRTTIASPNRVKGPLAQPKFDNNVAELEELTDSRTEREPVSVSGISGAPEKSDWSRVASGPIFGPASGVAASRAAVLTKPSTSSDNKSFSEEREVFEL